ARPLPLDDLDGRARTAEGVGEEGAEGLVRSTVHGRGSDASPQDAVGANLEAARPRAGVHVDGQAGIAWSVVAGGRRGPVPASGSPPARPVSSGHRPRSPPAR